MAKKSGRKNKQKENQQTTPYRPRGMVYMILMGVVLAAWVTWRFEPSRGLGAAILIGLAFAAAWWIFVGAYWYSEYRSRNKG